MAILADTIRVRDGLLFVIGGGINQLTNVAFPAPLGVDFGALIELEPAEFSEVAAIEISVKQKRPGGTKGTIGKLGAAIVASPEDPSRPSSLPLTFNLSGIMLSGPGDYEVVFTMDGLMEPWVLDLSVLRADVSA